MARSRSISPRSPGHPVPSRLRGLVSGCRLG